MKSRIFRQTCPQSRKRPPEKLEEFDVCRKGTSGASARARGAKRPTAADQQPNNSGKQRDPLHAEEAKQHGKL